MRIYAFCRTTDDLGDESPDGSALARLARWNDEVVALFAGEPPVHPVLVALAETIARRAIPAQPFLDLIEANVRISASRAMRRGPNSTHIAGSRRRRSAGWCCESSA